jgi:hypothetical protein
MMVPLAKVGLLAGLATAPTWAEDAPRPTVGILQSSGEGCPTGTAFATLGRTPDGRWNYDIVFSSFQAVTSWVTPRRSVACEVAVDVTPPPGYRLRVARALVQGTHLTEGDASTLLDGHYTWQMPSGAWTPDMRFSVEPARGAWGHAGASRVSRVEHIPSTVGNWGATFDDTSDDWSPCADGGAATVRLMGRMTLEATRGRSGVDAEIALQRSAVGLGWSWVFERCGGNADLFSGTWSSTYVTAGGQQVQATIHVQGDHGTYRAFGWTGQLFDIRIQGNHVHGRWSALGQDGWFEFEVQRESFSGEWGFRGASVPSGRWWGTR